MINGREAGAIFVACLLVLAAPIGSMYGEINPSTPECSIVAGTIVHKENDDAGYRLYVDLADGWDDSEEGYKVWVGNTTYQEYQIGDSYSEIVCNLDAYNEIRQFIDHLTTIGIAEMSP